MRVGYSVQFYRMADSLNETMSLYVTDTHPLVWYATRNIANSPGKPCVPSMQPIEKRP